MFAIIQLFTATVVQAVDATGKITTGLSIALILVCGLLAMTLYKKEKLSKENARLREQLREMS